MVETKNLDIASGSISRMEPMKLSSRVNGYLCVVLHFLQADTHLDIEGFLLLVSSSVLCIQIYGLCFLRLYPTEYKQYLCSFLNSTFTINLDRERLQVLSLSILKYTMFIYYLCFLDSIWDWSLFFLSFICIKFFYKKSIQYKYHIGSQHGYYIRGQWEHNTGGHYEYNTCGGYKYNTSCKIWLKHKGSIWF